MKSSGMCTLVTLRGRYLRLARSFGGSGARLRGPERGAGAMPARFSSNSSASGSCGICTAGQPALSTFTCSIYIYKAFSAAGASWCHLCT